MFRLGQILREHYNYLLGDIYYPGLVYARSSDTDRTKSSLQLVLAGLFPPSKEEKWKSNLKWQPIPYEYRSTNEDHVCMKIYYIYLRCNGIQKQS